MSQIASFYVLPAARFDDLVIAATAKVVTVERRSFVFLKKRSPQVVDNFWPFVRKVARESDDCPYPGGIFLDLDLVLESHGLILFNIATRDLSDRLSNARSLPELSPSKRPSWVRGPLRENIPVFDHPTAVAALTRLTSCGLSEKEVRAYARESYSPKDEEPATATILGAFELTKTWLSSVSRTKSAS